MKMNFHYFQIQNSISQTDKAEKVDKERGHLSSFHVSILSCGP